jgi:transcriptional regulator with AAA-type ATPase domain/predicted ATPase
VTSTPGDALSGFIGQSPEIVAVRDRARRLLGRWSPRRRPPPVLIQGETGTGKGLLARLIHQTSPRAAQPFVDINCAAMPDTLLEAELFGYERGAFTDARQAKPGLVQVASGGTLFLDEIGLLSAAAQAKLLTALDEGTIRRLGGTRAEPVDVWVIAATNEPLDERSFRRDLFHRLAVLTLELPPLRSRPADIVSLAEYFLARACADYGLSERTFTDDARAALTAYAWPGNTRELGNVIERAALLADTSSLTAEHLALQATRKAAPPAPAAPSPPKARRARPQRDDLERVLEETGWNVTQTAALLGITRNTVRARLARAGLRRPGDAAVAPAPLPPVRPDVAGPAFWEARRLTFLRVQVLAGEAGPRLAGHLQVISHKLEAFGGRVEGVSPRALLAVFGLEPSDEPTVRAGHGALAARNAARPLRSRGDLQLAVGLHTEEVLVREGDDATVLDADASGRVWGMLQSALEHAAPDTIVATTTAAALLRRRFIVTRVDDETFGYRVERLWQAQALARGPRAPMVGRREELAFLASRLAIAAEGRGQVVSVVGEAGIGKSRLLAEWLAAAVPRAVECLEGRCLPTEALTPFYPILQIARTACGLEEADSPSVIREKVTRAVVQTDLPADAVSVELHYLLGAREEPPETPGAGLTKRLYGALQQLFLALSRRRPLVMVVEDLHWIDPTSAAWLATLIDSIASAPILVVATYRSEYRPPWWSPSDAVLSLAPLPEAESVTLIRSLLGARASSEALERSIQAKAEGNPLFLEELSLAAIERGDGVLPERIPVTVEETVASRLARLEARQRRVLRAAAVIGREFSLRVLHHVSDVAEADLDAMLRQFQRCDFLAAGSAAERRYVFKHALVQEAAYAGLSAPTRSALHLRVLDAIEQLYPERITDFVERLAHHAEQGDDHRRATRYLLLAGGKAAARSALAEAVIHLSRGLDLLAGFAPSPDRDRQELDFQVAMGNVLRTSRGSAAPETERAYARARDLVRQVGDPSRLGPALVGEWSGHLLKARYDQAQLVAEELFACAERQDDALLRVVGHRSLGMTALYRGDFQTARDRLERGIDTYRDDLHARAILEYGVDPHIGCLAYLGRALWCLGYPDRALARNRQAVADAEAEGTPLAVAIARGVLTSIHQVRREPRETLEASARAITHASEWGITYWIAQATVLRAWAEAVSTSGPGEAGRLADARQSLEQYRATGSLLALTWFQILRAETCRARGQLREGLTALDTALAHANQTGERYHEAEIHRLKGELLLIAGGDVEAARACFHQALDVARAQHARSWELRAATSLARVLHDEHRDADARAVLAPVYAWFTEGFATPDLTEAQALLATLGG